MSGLLICKRFRPPNLGSLKLFLHLIGKVQNRTSVCLLGIDSTNYFGCLKNHTSAFAVTTRHYASQSTHEQKRDENAYGNRSVFYPVIGVAALLVTAFGLRWYVGRAPADVTKSLPSEVGENTTDRKSSVSHSKLENRSKTTGLPDELSASFGLPVSTVSPTSVSVPQEETDALSNDQAESPVHQKVSAHRIPLEEEDSELPSLVYKDESKVGFPSHVKYLIVGTGTAGLAAARSIRASDPKSQVLMVSGGSDHLYAGEPGIAETNFVEPPPYLRPPLSKELWRRDRTREANLLQTDGDIRRHSWLYYEAESFYLKPEDLLSVEYGGVALLRGDPVAKLDPDTHIATLVSGRTITYDRCLLATGGRPKRLKQLETCEATGKNLVASGLVSYFRSLGDYKRLRDLTDKLRKTEGKIAVIGGGFLGSELTVSLLTRPKRSKESENQERSPERAESSDRSISVLHVFRESLPMGHTLPPCLSSATARFETTCGAELWPSSEVVCASVVSANEMDEKTVSKTPPTSLQLATVNDVSPEKVRLRIRQSGFAGDRVEEVDVDHVVLALGIEPNTDLSDHAGLEVDHRNGGFLVNAEMEARAGIYAAGDAASYWDPVLGYRRRVEHLNFAEETGALAGRNMVASLSPTNDGANHGASSRVPARYQYQSSFWSSLGSEVSWDAVGYVDSQRLLTRSFFLSNEEGAHDTKTSNGSSRLSDSIPDSEFGRLGRGVVFYLTPSEKRLVGILLWNLPEEIYSDKEYTAPSRLNIARNMLAGRHLIGKSPVDPLGGVLESEEEQLRRLASYFDLPGTLEADYKEIKSYAEAKRQELLKSSPTTPGEQETITPPID
ncbi:unnamed protein product [Dicrocoelium dendriticum]|nr:unnamed protein product [Dicrocoelium dendriticum]